MLLESIYFGQVGLFFGLLDDILYHGFSEIEGEVNILVKKMDKKSAVGIGISVLSFIFNYLEMDNLCNRVQKPGEESSMWSYSWFDYLLIGAGAFVDGIGRYCTIVDVFYITPQEIWEKLAGILNWIHDGAGDLFLTCFAEIVDGMLEGVLGGGKGGRIGGAATAVVQSAMLMVTQYIWSQVYEYIVGSIATCLVYGTPDIGFDIYNLVPDDLYLSP